MLNRAKRFYEFGSFRLDPAEHLLLRRGVPLSLPPKAFATLVVLVEASGHMFSKEELLRAVWPDTFVEETNLTQCISTLRKALGENENGDSFIETVPKLGYRFIAKVHGIGGGDGELVFAKHSRTHIVVLDQEEQETSSDVEDAAGTEALAPRRTLSWHPWKWLGLLAGVSVVLIAGFVVYARRPVKLTERDSILLADFENSTAAPVFDDTLKRALALKLEESPFLSVVPDQRVRETLRYMGRSPDEKLTPAIAREVCQRRGVKALLSGSIARLGSQYVISLEAANCETGDILAREQVDAAGESKVLQAMGGAISQLRGRLGESLSSVQKFDVSMEEATTPSLEALRAFSLGENLRAKGQQIEAIPFFEHAIQLDSNFAMSYNRLAALYLGIGEPARSSEYSKKAFELRQHGTERERLILSASYYYQGIGDFDKAIVQYDVWKKSYPRDFVPHTNLAALYNDAGQFELALEEGREGLRISGGHALSYNTTGWAALRSGRVVDAKGIFDQAIANKFDNTMMHRGLFAVAFLDGDAAALEHEAGLARGKPDEFRTVMFEAQVAAFSGKLREAAGLYSRSAELAQKNHFADAAAAILAGDALVEASFGKDRQARERALQSLKLAHGRDALGIAASAFALSGDLKRAQECIDELAKGYPSDSLVNSVALPSASAAIEIKRGNPAKAIEVLSHATTYEIRALRVRPGLPFVLFARPSIPRRARRH
jgi:eukaryotic-like serine/threonine-protein kinase